VTITVFVPENTGNGYTDYCGNPAGLRLHRIFGCAVQRYKSCIDISPTSVFVFAVTSAMQLYLTFYKYSIWQFTSHKCVKSEVYEKYTSICIAHFYAKRLKCAQTWITQFYLQITPCLPLLPSHRTSPPFGWYSFYRPTEGRRLSRPGWLVTYRNKVPPPGVEPVHGHPSQY